MWALQGWELLLPRHFPWFYKLITHSFTKSQIIITTSDTSAPKVVWMCSALFLS